MTKTEIERIVGDIDHFDDVVEKDGEFIISFSSYDSGVKERSHCVVYAYSNEQHVLEKAKSASAECDLSEFMEEVKRCH